MTARATALVREALLHTLALLPVGEFALRADVLAAACADRRALSAQRGLALSARGGHQVHASVLELSSALLDDSLPRLGLVDAGRIDAGGVVRLAQRARAWFDDAAGERDYAPPQPAALWRDDMRLFFGPECSIASVIEAARYGRVWHEEGGVGVEFTADSLARGADHDPDLAGLRSALTAVVKELSSGLEHAIELARAQRPLFHVVAVAGFLAIDDATMCRALYDDPEGGGLFAHPPLSEGLLLRAGVSQAKLAALLMRHGARLYTREQH